MKQGWKIKTLGEVCRYIKDQGHYADLPYIGMEDIESGTNIFTGDLNNKSVDSATFRFKSGFVLFGRLRPYLRKVLIPSFEGHCSTEIFPIQTAGALKAEFLKHWFMLDSTVSLVESTCTGSRMPRANMNDVLNFDIPIPSIPEQERIIGVLDSAFAKIEALRANAQQNLQNTKDLFQASLKQELTPKQDWETQELDAIADITSSKRIYKDEYVREGIPFYRTKEIKELANGHEISLELFISTERYQEIKNKFGVPQIGDILISAVGTIGEILVIRDESEFYFKDGNIIWIKDVSKVTSSFLSYNLKSIIEQLKSITIGAAYSALTIEKFKEMEVSFPDSKIEQQAIVRKLDALSECCRAMEENYHQTIVHCNALKQSLLTKAFNGEL